MLLKIADQKFQRALGGPEGYVTLRESSGKVAGGSGNFKSKEDEELVMILHNIAAKNHWDQFRG